jgi:hypothetical protein
MVVRMNRALVNAPYTLEATVLSGTDPTDPSPDSATITVRRADGTAIITDSGTNNTGTGTFARTLTSAQMALLDTLTAEWTVTVGAETTVLRTYVEVVGGYLCPLTDLAAEFAQQSGEVDADYDRRLGQIRTTAEQRLENECGQAFVPRYSYERNRRVSNRRIRLGWPNLREVRSLDVDGYEYGSAVDALTFGGSEMLAVGYGSYATVGYEHGHDFPDERVRNAVVLAAREMFASTSATSGGYVVRREADGQAVTYASPSSAGGFLDPGLRSLVRDLQRPLVA